MPPPPPKKGGLAALMVMSKPDSKGDMADVNDPDMDGDDDTSPEGDTDKDEGKQYLVPPKGFKSPEDVPMGGSFSGTFRAHIDEDGRLCMEALNNIPLAPGAAKEPAVKSEDDADDKQEQPDLQNVPQDDLKSAMNRQYS